MKNDTSDEQVLQDLEKNFNISIPRREKLEVNTPGVEFKEEKIIGLILYNKSIEILPKSIGNLQSLQILDLSHNNLTSIPKTIANLKSIEKLDLRFNKISNLPNTFSKLNSIKMLDLSQNELKNLPESFGDLKSLEILNLINNHLVTLPNSFGNLKNLQFLSLWNNQLSSLPSSFGELIAIKKLVLRSNKLKTLPNSFGNLEALKELNLRKNQLESLPESFSNLKSLEKLYLFENKLKTLPQSFGNLKDSLKYLFLTDNQFNKIPSVIWPLENLEQLELNGNPLDDESKKILARNDIPLVLEFCRKTDNITIFISHAWNDQETYRVHLLKQYLEKCDEIYQVHICEKDLTGNIREFMDEKVPKSHLVLFIGTNRSISSLNCQHELALSKIHNVEIIPIKGIDIHWTDLNHIDLSREGCGFLDLGIHKGLDFNPNNFNVFCKELYAYIKKYKRDINLFEKEKANIDKIKLQIEIILDKYMKSEEYFEGIRNNLKLINSLIQKYYNNLISNNEFIRQWTKIFNQ